MPAITTIAVLIILGLCSHVAPFAGAQANETTHPPRNFPPKPRAVTIPVYDVGMVRMAYAAKGFAANEVVFQLLSTSDLAIERTLNPPLSVLQKKETAPSGRKRDYYSIARYWWPDLNSVDGTGIPYVRFDGLANPDASSDKYDRAALDRMLETLLPLAASYYITREVSYAQKVVDQVRTWFTNETSGMMPHMEFAQRIIGVNYGSAGGLTEMWRLPRVLDALALVQDSGLWTGEDQYQFNEWLDEYYWWLTADEIASNFGPENSDGFFYDVQVASVALYLGDWYTAFQVANRSKTWRIPRQVQGSGKQPIEVLSAKPWSNSVNNLDAMMTLAFIGKQVGVDLWRFKTVTGAGIEVALDYLLGYAFEGLSWPHGEASAVSQKSLYALVRRSAWEYKNETRGRVLEGLIDSMVDDGWVLRQEENAFFPGPAGTVDCVVTAWSNWTNCSVPCGGGNYNRTRSVEQPAAGYGSPCPALLEQRACNVQDCPQDCVLSSWGDWGDCSVPCGGGGVRQRHRTMLVPPKGSGAPCPGQLEDDVGCYNEPCSWGDGVPGAGQLLIAVSLQGSGNLYDAAAGSALVHTLGWQIQVARFVAYLAGQLPSAAHTVYSGLDMRVGTPPVSGRYIAPLDPSVAELRYVDFQVWVRVAVVTEEPRAWRSRNATLALASATLPGGGTGVAANRSNDLGPDASLPASVVIVERGDRALWTARQLAVILRNATLLEEVLAEYKQESEDNQLVGVRELYLTGGNHGHPDSSSIEIFYPPLRKNSEGLYDVFGLEFESAAIGNALPALFLSGIASLLVIVLLYQR